jgi:hypothetical protein
MDRERGGKWTIGQARQKPPEEEDEGLIEEKLKAKSI